MNEMDIIRIFLNTKKIRLLIENTPKLLILFIIGIMLLIFCPIIPSIWILINFSWIVLGWLIVDIVITIFGVILMTGLSKYNDEYGGMFE